MLRQPRRLIASLIAIVFGVAFAAVTLTLSASLEKSLVSFTAGDATGSAVVIRARSEEHPLTVSAAQDIRQLPGVTLQAKAVAYLKQRYRGGEQPLLLSTLPRFDDVTRLVEGRLPGSADEVVISQELASTRELKVGSTIDLGPSAAAESGKLSVVGILAVRTASAIPSAYGFDSDVLRYSGASGYLQAYVFSERPPAELKAQIVALPSVAQLQVQTLQEYIAEQRKEAAEVMSTITNFFLGFAVVALLVAGLVIFNTFSILVVQRTRQLALLRCVGATRAQVFRQVLAEAVILGLVASGIGVLVGVGLGYGLVRLNQAIQKQDTNSFAVSLMAICLPLAIGFVVTVVAAVLPARRATRVAPLAALRPQLESVTATRAGVVRLVLGGLLLAAGTAGLLYGAIKPGMGKNYSAVYPVIGVAGGIVSFIGVMFLGIVLIPALAKLVGLLPSLLGGVPGRLAADNSRRNPGRAAAAASALLIGVTLISMTLVGAETGRRTYSEALDRTSPIDLMLTPESQQVPDEMLRKTSASSVVAAAARADTASVQMNGRQTPVVGLDPAIRTVVRDGRRVEGLSDTTILLPKTSAVPAGTQVTVAGPDGKISLTVVLADPPLDIPTVTLTSLSRVTQERQQSVWARIADGKQAKQAITTISQDLSEYQVHVGGGAMIRSEFDTALNGVLIVINALLGVSILIALIGITNTLGLSVLERTQESGLLRALGLTRGQLRWMFSLEALTLAAVAALLGIGLGIGFGVAGAYAILKGVATVAVAIPWASLALVVTGALVAGLVASVAPAVRAGRIQPAAALTVE